MFQPSSEPLLPHLQLMIMSCGGVMAQAIQTTATLRLADLVQDGPQSAARLASATGTDEKNLYRLLRVLVALGIFEETEPGSFGPTALSTCLHSDNPRSLYHLARMGEGWQWKALGELPYSVRTGQPAFEHVFGKDIWRYFAEDDPDAGELFNRAMTSLSGPADELLAAAYDFSGVQTLVDVGGGVGGFITTVLKRNPGVKGILFDRPPVIEDARQHIAAAGLQDRIELVAGDFLQSVPAGGDLYFMRQILLDWDDEASARILRHCLQAMKPGGKILAAERVLKSGKADLLGKLIDLVLMVNLFGYTRDEAEFGKLFTSAGLTVSGVIPTQSVYTLLEAMSQ